MPRFRNIDDAQLLRAMAHPLRLRLYGSLVKDGPATASELARRLDESSGATSYHLRMLAKYGFIEDDRERNRGRERAQQGRRDDDVRRGTSSCRSRSEGHHARRRARP